MSNLFVDAGEKLKSVGSYEQLKSALADSGVQQLLAHPEKGPGWKKFVEGLNRKYSAQVPDAPPPPEQDEEVPEAPTAEAPCVEPEEETVSVEGAAEPEEGDFEPSYDWEGKKFSELDDDQLATLAAELTSIAIDVFDGNEAQAKATVERYLNRGINEDWEAALGAATTFLENAMEWQASWEAVRGELGKAKVFLAEGLTEAVKDHVSGTALRLVVMKAREGRYGPTRPYREVKKPETNVARAMREAKPHNGGRRGSRGKGTKSNTARNGYGTGKPCIP